MTDAAPHHLQPATAYRMQDCPFCGSEIRHVESWAKSFEPPRLYHEWHHIDQNDDCWICRRSSMVASSSDDPDEQARVIRRWNTRAASAPGAVRALATTLLDFIDNEGPSATAWEPISATAKALRVALATPEEASTEAQPDCNLCFGKGSVVDRYDVVDCKACGGSGTASTAAGEVVDPACMLATASNEPCKPTGENHKRCAICGFIVDASFAATKPTIDFTMAGRSKKSASPPAAQTDGVRETLEQAKAALIKIRACSIAGCEEGYGKPEMWADALFASHGDVADALKTIDAALSLPRPARQSEEN